MKLFIAILAASTSLCLADGKVIYEKECAKCHGLDGKGQTKMGQKLGAKDYTDTKVQDSVKDDGFVKAIKEGLKDKEGKTLMKPSDGIDGEDVKQVIAYMRSFKK